MFSLFVFLLGCPLPPEESGSQNRNNVPQNQGGNQGGQGGQIQGGNQGANSGGQGGAPGGGAPPSAPVNNAQQNGQVGGPGGATGGAPGGAPGGVLHDIEKLKAQQSQEEILEGDNVKIRGVIKGECSGSLILDVLSLTDSPADAQTKGPLTGKKLDGTGEFVIAVPKDASVSITALCDENNDQRITEKDDKLSPGARLGKMDADKENVELVLESIQSPSTAGGAPGASPGAGGPGAGGPGAGTPGAVEGADAATKPVE
ncbi:MAG: hypothetical protein VX278_20810 [Myxococcota bacterium]|nr:hypothetical protein [Myxococcota bacterium]